MAMKNSNQDLVDVALDAAVFENDYRELMYYDPKELASDLICYDARLQGMSVPDILQEVKAYLSWYHSSANSNK